MKYTNLRAAALMLIISLLTGCATFDDIVGQSKQEDNSVIEPEQGLAEVAEQAAPIDPVSAHALLLKSQDNQYLLNKTDVPSAVRAQFAEALRLKQEKDYARATEHLLHITQSQPNLSGPWVLLAEISHLQNQPAEANTADHEQQKNYLQQAIKVNPANYFAHNRLGSLLRTEGDFTQAKVHYLLAIKSWPGFAPAYLNMAILDDLYFGDKNQALENYLLYQALIDTPERKVKGWIADLTRQIKAQQSEVLE